MRAKPRLFVSKCIETCACRYDGQKINSNFALKLFAHADIVTECPETAIGLGIPRKPVRIVAEGANLTKLRLVQPETGADYTEKMNEWAASYLSKLGEVDGFLMKSKSPSSGLKDVKIYGKGEKAAALTKRGAGFFGGMIKDFYPGIPAEDEARLLNYAIRDHFLKTVFCLAELRAVIAEGKASGLMKFHEHNKLLFMSYSQSIMRKLGKIAAGSGKGDFLSAAQNYRLSMISLFSSMPSAGNSVNAYEHAFGYFKKGLSSGEKKYFIDMLGKYRKSGLRQDIIQALLKSYAIRFGSDYILSQSFFSPYPEELSGGD